MCVFYYCSTCDRATQIEQPQRRAVQRATAVPRNGTPLPVRPHRLGIGFPMVEDRLNLVSLGVKKERRVVLGMIVPESRSAFALSPGNQPRGMKSVDLRR